MKKKTYTHTHPVIEPKTAPKFSQIKLGVDVHADSYRVVRQIDSATPQPAQKMSPEQFLKFAARQRLLAEQVYWCYEAGPFGYSLHRKLLEMGIENVVIRPQNWDELGRGIKTDKTDALALVQRLDRYVQGNQKALAVIRVPTIQEEQQRVESRHREQLQKDRQTHEAQGRSLLLYQGYRVMGRWWKETAWQRLKKELPFWLGEVLRREVLDWHRFRNRRQVASLTGMCPGVRASGPRSVSGPITKHGNPRLRRALVELAWRVVRYQPRYGPVVRWKEVLQQRQNRGGRKKAIIAIGRRLAIDLWRLETGRCTTRDLQLS